MLGPKNEHARDIFWISRNVILAIGSHGISRIQKESILGLNFEF